MLMLTVLAVILLEGDATIGLFTVPLALYLIFGREKDTAAAMLQKMLEKNGISSLEELEAEEYYYTLFSYKGRHEIKLLRQCMYKVMGAKSDRRTYRTKGTRQKIGIYCTKVEKIEIERG